MVSLATVNVATVAAAANCIVPNEAPFLFIVNVDNAVAAVRILPWLPVAPAGMVIASVTGCTNSVMPAAIVPIITGQTKYSAVLVPLSLDDLMCLHRFVVGSCHISNMPFAANVTSSPVIVITRFAALELAL